MLMVAIGELITSLARSISVFTRQHVLEEQAGSTVIMIHGPQHALVDMVVIFAILALLMMVQCTQESTNMNAFNAHPTMSSIF